MNREQLLAAMQALLEAADAEQRELTAEESAKFDDYKRKVAALDANAARRAEVQAAREMPAAAAAPVAAAPAPIAGAVAAAPARTGGEQARAFENLGEFMYSALLRPTDPRLASLWREPRDLARDRGLGAEQRMDTGSLGGFMVPEQFVQTIREVPVQSALIRPRADVIPAGSPPDAKITFPYLEQGTSENVFGGVEVDWVDGEGGTKPDTSGALGQFSLQPNEWAAVLTVTDKLLRNWAAASSFFTKKIRQASTSFEDFQFFRTGTGVGRPLSILNSNAKITVASSGAAGTVSFTDVVNMVAQHMVGASSVWSISRALYTQIVMLRNESPGDGSLIFVPGNVTKGIPDSLMGIPIYWNDRAPAASVLGSFALLNLDHYLIKDGSGPFVVSDGGIVNFKNNKTLIKVFGNVDGQPDMKEPFTLEGGFEVSPFVFLNTAA